MGKRKMLSPDRKKGTGRGKDEMHNRRIPPLGVFELRGRGKGTFLASLG